MKGATWLHAWCALLWLSQTSSVCASYWSLFGSSDGSAAAAADQDANGILVSPIINRELKVSVKAHGWASTPSDVVCEAWSLLQPQWGFLDRWVQHQASSMAHSNSYKRMTELVLQTAAATSDRLPVNLELLEYSLVIRSQSPACQLQRGLAVQSWIQLAGEEPPSTQQAFAVVHPHGKLARSPDDLLDLLSCTSEDECQLEVSAIDDLLLPGEVPRSSTADDGASIRTDGGLVILYGDMTSAAFAAFYTKLVEMDAPFVVRFMDGHAASDEQQQQQQPTILQGYGVRLDIRNVEYKVFDDHKRTISGDSDEAVNHINVSSLEALSDQFLAGVNLTALGLSEDASSESAANEALQLQQQIWKLHEAQIGHSQLIPPTWQRRQLSVQAAHTLLHNNDDNEQSFSDPLVTMQEISQNLPSVASTLVHVKVPPEFEDIVQSLQAPLQGLIRESRGGLWINGRPVAIDRPSFNVFELIQLLQKEEKEIQQFQNELANIFAEETRTDALKAIYQAWLQGADFFAAEDDDDDDDDEDEYDGGMGRSQKPAKPADRIDVGRGWKQSIMYLNDIEKDKQYASWPRSMQQMLMAMQYGMAPSVRRNVFTTLAVLDPTQLAGDGSGRPVALDVAAQLMQNQFPLRLGMLIVGQDDIAACEKWIQSTRPEAGVACPMPENETLFGTPPSDSPPAEEELESTPITARLVHRLLAYVMDKYSRELLLPYNDNLIVSIGQKSRDLGPGKSVSAADLLKAHRKIISAMNEAPETVPELVDGLIASEAKSSDEDASPSLYTYGKALRFAADKGLKPGMSFLNGLSLPGYDDDDANEKIGKVLMEEQKYIFEMVARGVITDTSPKSIYGKLLTGDHVHPKLHRSFVDSENPNNFANLQFKKGAHVPPTTVVLSCESSLSAAFVVVAVLDDDSTDRKQFDDDLMSALFNAFGGQDGCKGTFGYKVVSQADIVRTADDNIPDSNFIWINGRIYALQPGEVFTHSDLEILAGLDMAKSTAVTKLLLPRIKGVPVEVQTDVISKVVGFLVSTKVQRSDPVAMINERLPQMGLPSNPMQIDFESQKRTDGIQSGITAIVDPISKTAQRLSPLLIVMRDKLKLPVTLILAPTAILDGDSKIPITSYYRFVADPDAFQDSAVTPMAHFSNLPTQHVFTVQLDVPEPWDVQQTKTVQDTDNLRCSLENGCSDAEHRDDSPYSEASASYKHLTEVEYGLSSLLFFGQCYEVKGKMTPPNGLQLTLSPHTELGVSDAAAAPTESAQYSDTLVMKTAGYWQLRGNPGIWDLNILKESRGAEIFDMIKGTFRRGSLKLDKSDDNTYQSKRLVMDSFVSKGEVLLVRRKQGYQHASLFYDSDKARKGLQTKDDDVVNVFSLATGHLYERFLKIMMLSVTKRTSSKVKFWLFENFLSPSFKASARAMADRIGCEVEFVTYKWPEFLRGQTEKQRVIWGYKILFLDVLFPLNVKKIIYVDADQVVRGDLTELRDMDLNGAPYGYTPMCSSREETKGYQFWNTGFWKTHLRGKPYHISALYVVDLERFRKDLVGDKLRSVYQQLSADPNSLANLDQDLPNYAQHQVPIFSLPQEWLWCESWCSDETKATSKTIDLCNNPQHKEAKVSMAKRIINGNLFNESWVELDAEVESYYQDFLGHEQL